MACFSVDGNQWIEEKERQGRRNKGRSKVLEKMKEERVRTQIEGWSFIETGKPLWLSSDETDCACTESCRLVDFMWEDERVWLESLVLNTFVCLLDNP